jgi:putative membrane protein
MSSSASTPPKASLSDYLATERTLLAWIRTGLALMGFGFVVARFGLFLEELHAAQNLTVTQHTGLSLWFGTALILVGVGVNAMAGWRYLRVIRNLDRGHITRSTAAHPVAVALLVALVGMGMAIYLISVRNAHPSSAPGGKGVSYVQNKLQRYYSDSCEPICGRYCGEA